MRPTWTHTTATVACPHCGEEFRREEYLDLHRGQDHAGALSEGERAAYEAARETERERLRLFKYKALGALVVTYFVMVMVYALAT